MSPHLPARLVYHLADAVNWDSIKRLGLLSASRLMDLAGLTEAQRNSPVTKSLSDHPISGAITTTSMAIWPSTVAIKTSARVSSV